MMNEISLKHIIEYSRTIINILKSIFKKKKLGEL